MELIKENINSNKLPKGFIASGIHCGIKRQKKDLALIVSETEASAAAVFTLNKVQAAPVLLSKKHLAVSNNFKAIIVNSGNANACTGDEGYANSVTMANVTAEAIGVKPEQVFVASTGVIGEQLPMEKIITGISKAKNSLVASGLPEAAEAILTTDTFVKTISSSFSIENKEITIYAMAKGSGMIHPNMATMLGFVLTDAGIEKNIFQSLLKRVVDKTFNKIIVDGDTSTNDMVIALANGASGVYVNESTESFAKFETALFDVLKKLSLDIVIDGEGATKLIEITVKGAPTIQDAAKAGKAVALSPLVKTAMHGEDANWGRIIAAVGYSGIEFDPAKLEIIINGTSILHKNYIVTLPILEANKTLKAKKIDLEINLNIGQCSSTCWTCDFSEEYVKINGSYRS